MGTKEKSFSWMKGHDLSQKKNKKNLVSGQTCCIGDTSVAEETDSVVAVVLLLLLKGTVVVSTFGTSVVGFWE